MAIAALSVVLERLLYARLYRASELDQVLFSIGLVFVLIAAITLGIGPESQTLVLPEWLRGQTDLGFIHYRTYSLALDRRRHAAADRAVARVRAHAVGRSHPSCGGQPPHGASRSASTSGGCSPLTFAIGSGLAAVGGGLGAEILGLDPQYPLRYLPYFLIVVAVGGLGRVTGVFLAALLIGVLDFVLKVEFPKGGSMFIYALTLIALLWRPQGLFAKRGG